MNSGKKGDNKEKLKNEFNKYIDIRASNPQTIKGLKRVSLIVIYINFPYSLIPFSIKLKVQHHLKLPVVLIYLCVYIVNEDYFRPEEYSPFVASSEEQHHYLPKADKTNTIIEEDEKLEEDETNNHQKILVVDENVTKPIKTTDPNNQFFSVSDYSGLICISFLEIGRTH